MLYFFSFNLVELCLNTFFMKSTLVLFVFVACGLQAQKLIPVKKNGKFGFEKEGIEVIPCMYEYACHFSEKLALVRLNDSWGYIDSLGNMQIPFKFQKAEPFLSGKAYVKENGLIGIIRNDGTYLIQPEYSGINEAEFGLELRNVDKIGFYFSENNEIIPAKYRSINSNGYYSNCQLDDKHWDLYYRGKLIIDSMQAKIEFFGSEDCFKVFKNQKVGVYDLDQGWLIEPIFTRIERQEFANYKIKQQVYHFLYVLSAIEENDLDFMDELEDYYTYFKLAKADGSLISESKMKGLNSYVSEFSEMKGEICLQTNIENQIAVVNSNFDIISLSYSTFKKHADWFITEKDYQTYILNRFLQPIDSFSKVESYFELDYENTAWEEGDVVFKEIVDEPFLLIFTVEGEKTLKAVYSLEEKKRISSWMDESESLQISREFLGGKSFYKFFGSNSGIGYYVQGMRDLVPMDLELCEVFSDFLIIKKFDSDLKQLLYLADQNFVKICSEPEIKLSESIFKYYEEGERERSVFTDISVDFIYTLNKESKYGIVTLNGKFINESFDSINPILDFAQYIRVYKNGKEGVLNLINGHLISPLYDQSLTLQYATDEMEVYATVNGNNFPFYLTDKGQKYFSQEPKFLIFKEKGLYGLKTNNDFDGGENITSVVLPAKYKSMIQDPIGKCFIVSGADKKVGLVNQYDDTLDDFKYDKLKYASISNYMDGSLYYSKVGKRRGVVSQLQGELIPAKYEMIEPFGNDQLQNIFIVSIGKKKGLHGSKGLILPVEFETISKQADFEVSSITYFIGEKMDEKYVKEAYYSDDGYAPSDTVLSQPYDVVLGSYGFVKTGNLYHKYYLRDNQFVEETGDLDVQLSNEVFTLVFKNGKYGATDLVGDALVPFLYESASFMEGRPEVMIGVENGQTYYIYVETNERFTPEQW